MQLLRRVTILRYWKVVSNRALGSRPNIVTLLAIVLPIVCLIGVVWICYKMIRAIVKSPAFRRRWESAGSGE